MRRSFRTLVSFAGGIPRVGTLGWYAMPRQGIGSEMRFGGMESETWCSIRWFKVRGALQQVVVV